MTHIYRNRDFGRIDDEILLANVNVRRVRRGLPWLRPSELAQAQQEAPDHFEDRLPRRGIGRKGGA